LTDARAVHTPLFNVQRQVTQLGYPEALKATKWDVVYMLEKQLEAAGHFQYGRERQRRQYLEKRQSLNSYVLALAGMAGLTTAPFLLYKIIGFDVLHVRSFLISSSAPAHCYNCDQRCCLGLLRRDGPLLTWGFAAECVSGHWLCCVVGLLKSLVMNGRHEKDAGAGSWSHVAPGSSLGEIVPITL